MQTVSAQSQSTAQGFPFTIITCSSVLCLLAQGAAPSASQKMMCLGILKYHSRDHQKWYGLHSSIVGKKQNKPSQYGVSWSGCFQLVGRLRQHVLHRFAGRGCLVSCVRGTRCRTVLLGMARAFLMDHNGADFHSTLSSLWYRVHFSPYLFQTEKVLV